MDHDGIVAGERGWPIGYLCHCDNVTFNRKINKKVRLYLYIITFQKVA